MNYRLTEAGTSQKSAWSAALSLWPLLRDQRGRLVAATLALLTSSVLNLCGPVLSGRVIDEYITRGNFPAVLRWCAVMLGLFTLASLGQYAQTVLMGGVGQQLLFRLRQRLFAKLQQLPLAFFQANRTGDLISRLNHDTDKVNSFFTQSLMQFLGSLVSMVGSGLFLLALNLPLGLAALAPALLLGLLTRLLSSYIRARNAASLHNLGHLSAEVADSLENYKVVVAYHRQDYFLQRFEEANQRNYQTALSAGWANKLFVPLYTLCNNLAQLSVLLYGLVLIAHSELTVGLLISYLVYVLRFYDPLRQLASLWASLQTALAGWDRIAAILSLESNMTPVTDDSNSTGLRMQFLNVDFAYLENRPVLSGVELALEAGKTYALVGPTGGGKTTTASLMARLYDPTAGRVLLDGRDLRSYSAAERSQKIGFILQEPFLQAGSLRDNLAYANEDYRDELLGELGMDELLSRFPQGLETQVASLSLGQKQIVAFMRAVLRRPDLLVLDEATANIDTVTEAILASILQRLPAQTTRVIIAHRLNTIANADEIYFVNQGHLVRAGSLDQAVAMLRQGQRHT